ncbi:hypothetical protein BU15DRAFT_78718 [Melanogaster broomeanus]|nr:hypothetical protein BU15DRAFT_78718 [Melanogaster broomeanus]
MQDQLDGGISVLIWCPSTPVPSTLTPEEVSVDLYITPHELQSEDSMRIKGDVATLVQAFCEEFAVPHLHRFTERCCMEAVDPLIHHFTVNPVSPQHLPTPSEATGVRIQCSALGGGMPNDSAAHTIGLKSRAVHKAAETVAAELTASVKATKRPQTPGTIVCQHHLADAFLLPTRTNQENISAPLSSSTLLLSLQGHPKFSALLISIGSHSDMVLDQFELGDEILPRLNVLLLTVHNSRWQAVLMSPEWNLPQEQAAALARGLLIDVHSKPGIATASAEVRKSSFVGNMLKGLGVLALLFMLKLTWLVLV